MITDRDYQVQRTWLKKQGIVIALFASFGIFGFYADSPSGVGAVFYIPAFILGAIICFLYQSLVCSHFHYQLDEDFLTVHEGVLNRSERHIPYGSLQDVIIAQDLLDRLFGIYTLRMENAVQVNLKNKKGTNFELLNGLASYIMLGSTWNGAIIPGLQKSDAENLRAALLQKIKDHPLANTGSGL